MKKITFIFILWLAVCMLCRAQVLPFRSYSIDKGLSEAVVNDLLQGSEGYLWVATGYGLNRYDGYDFENYYEDDGLINNKVLSLFMDQQKRIWIGTAGGVNVMEQDSIQTLSSLKPLDNLRVTDIMQDHQGEFWFATDGQGIWHLDGKDKLTQYLAVQGLGSNRIHAITEDKAGTLWFGTTNGLTSLKDGNFRNYTKKDGLADNTINDLKADSAGRLWIATRDGLSRFYKGRFKNFTSDDGLISNQLQAISLDDKGGVWIGTEEGASHFSRGAFSNFSTEQGLINNKVNAILFDREHNVWLGTYGSGISLFLGEQFKNYTTEQGLPNNLVTSITEDQNGTHWVASFGGLTKYENGKLTNYTEKDGLVNNNVNMLYVNQKNYLIIATQWGLSIYDGSHFTNYDEHDLPYHKIRAITESSKHPGEYWLGTYGEGLIRYKDGSFTTFSDSSGLANNTILSVKNGPDGAIWIASYGGVSRFEDGKFTNYSIKEGLPSNSVLDILITSDKHIWVSTFKGVAHYDKDSNSFIAITGDDGLPDELCYFIQQDDKGIFWIGTNKGVIRFDYQAYQQLSTDKKPRGAFKLITHEQGLVNNEMNAGGSFKDREGRLWFGSVGGLTVFDPSLANNNHAPPKIHIESVQLSGETVQGDHHLEVPSDNRNITFDYVGISFTAPNQVMYEYKLEGSGEDWQHTSQRSVRYSSLFPGEYTFQVKAQNSDGLWSPETASLSFTVLAPFWLRWWFFALLAIFLAGIIYFVYKYYSIRKMVDIERMRVRIASDLHDDVGSSLTEIALQSDFLQTTNASEELKESVQQIGTQSRRIVSSLDDIVWSIDARNDTLGDLTDRMQDYINTVLIDRQVLYHFEELDMDEKLSVEKKENLYLIFKEAVNNIAKHSNATKVDITLKTEGNSFHLIIHDNGTEISKKRKSGHGLRNMDMRAKRINASVIFENEDGFTIRVEGKYDA